MSRVMSRGFRAEVSDMVAGDLAVDVGYLGCSSSVLRTALNVLRLPNKFMLNQFMLHIFSSCTLVVHYSVPLLASRAFACFVGVC